MKIVGVMIGPVNELYSKQMEYFWLDPKHLNSQLVNERYMRLLLFTGLIDYMFPLTYEAVIDGEVERAADLLWTRAHSIFESKPEFFDAQNLQKMTASILSDNYGDDLDRLDERAGYIRRSATLLLEKCAGSVQEIYNQANGDAVIVLQKMSEFSGLGGGIGKKRNMIIRALKKYFWKDLRNWNKVDVSSDRQLMRVALRSGMVYVPVHIPIDDVADYSLIAELTKKAFRSAASYAKVSSPAELDEIAWMIGRTCCAYKRCTHCDGSIRGQLCDLKGAISCTGKCPISDGCKKLTFLKPPTGE